MELKRKLAKILSVILIITSMNINTLPIMATSQVVQEIGPNLELEISQENLVDNQVNLNLKCNNVTNIEAKNVVAFIESTDSLCSTTGSQLQIEMGDVEGGQSVTKPWILTVPISEVEQTYACEITLTYYNSELTEVYTKQGTFDVVVPGYLVKKGVTLSAEPDMENNCINLDWNSPEEGINYSYMIYQKHKNDLVEDSEYQSIPANDTVKVLQVYPNTPQLVGWVKQYGEGKITCDAISMSNFNKDPNSVWEYDVIVFGFWDCNNGWDLNENSRDVMKEYIESGKGVLFGHDTINSYIGHTYFNALAHYVNLTLGPVANQGGNKIKISKKGLLTNYPYKIGEVGDILSIPSSHISYQTPYGDIWMKFTSDDKFYLTTWNNCAMIQTGHSNGRATEDEQKLLMNTLYYLAQKTTQTSWVDHMGQDLSAPTEPKLSNLKASYVTKSLEFDLQAEDLGDDYEYYVEATHPDTGEKMKSNVEAVYLESGIKGYSIVIDQKPDTIPDNEIETEDGHFKVVVPDEYEMKDTLYIHVKALDKANNTSSVLHYEYNYKEANLPKIELALRNSDVQNGEGHIQLDYTNIGNGNAKNVKIKIATEEGIYLLDASQASISKEGLNVGESDSIGYNFVLQELSVEKNYNYQIEVSYQSENLSEVLTEITEGTLTVPASLPEEIELKYALFAAHPSNGLTLSGWKCNVIGDIYTGNDFKSQVSELYVTGSIDTTGSAIIAGWKKEVDAVNEKVESLEMPDLEDAILEAAGECRVYDEGISYIKDQNIIEQAIKVNGDVDISGTTFKGNCTIIAKGNINYNVMSFSGEGSVCLYSEEGNITINGSQIQVNGLLYAPNGKVTINTYDTTLRGAIYADDILLNGSVLNVTKSDENIHLGSDKSNKPCIFVSLPKRAEQGQIINAQIKSLNEAEIVSYKVQADGQDIEVSANGSFTLAMPGKDQRYHITAYAYDAKGNFDKKEYEIEVYTIIPTISVKASSNIVEQNEEASFLVKTTDEDKIKSITCTLNGEEVQLINGTYHLDTSELGEYRFTATISTLSGEAYSATETISVVSKDKEPPVVKVAFDKSTYYEGDQATAQLVVTDNVGVEKVQFSCNGKEFAIEPSIVIDNLVLRKNSIEVNAWDAAGNKKSEQYTILVYSAEPSVSVTVSSDSTLQNESAYFEVKTTGIQNIRSATYTLNNKAVSIDDAGKYVIDTSVTGTYLFTATIVSDLGRTYTSSGKIVVVSNDKEEPVINVTFDKELYYQGETAYATLQITDNIGVEKIEFVCNGESLPIQAIIPIENLVIGENTITVNASDKAGNIATKNYTISCIERVDEEAPKISISLTKEQVEVGEEVTAKIQVTDNVGVQSVKVYVNDKLEMEAPGTINFSNNEAGNIEIKVIAIDTSGNESSKTTICKVVDSRDKVNPIANISSPTVGSTISKPIDIIGTVTDETQLKKYTLQYAPDGTEDFITFAEGTSAKANQVLGQFNPADLPKGIYQIKLIAEDMGGNTAGIIVKYIVGDIINKEPILAVMTSTTVANVGTPVTVQAGITNGVPVQAITVYVDGSPIELINGVGTFTCTEAKIVQVEAVAITLEGKEIRETITCRIIDPEDKVPPEVMINSPEPGATITSPIDIIGTAKDNKALERYYLQYRLKGTEDYIVFSEESVSKEDEVLGRFDPTALENGMYEIQLVAEDKGGTINKLTTTYHVAGDMKIGQMSIGFTDISANVAGVNMSVTRNYNSFNKQKGDFGVGWTLGLNSIQMYEGSELGANWEQISKKVGMFTQYSFQPTQSHDVVITYGDGKSDTFEVGIDYKGQTPIVPIRIVDATYRCKTNSKVKLEIVGNKTMECTGGLGTTTFFPEGEYSNLDQPMDPQVFKLTREDGTEIIFHKQNGIQSITDKNGNQITVDKNGITNSTGKSITFTRDSEERIISATDLAGNATRYVYDNNGDLVEVINSLDQSVQFIYDNKHNLAQIIDPRGIAIARNEYDENGRLVASIDAKGNRMEYSHDVEGRQEVVKDRLGNTTLMTYDDEGHILSITDALGNVSKFEYDSKGNQTLRQNALGDVWSYKYTDDNKLISMTNPLGEQILTTYDTNGKIATIQDLQGNILNYDYNSKGQVTAIINDDGRGIKSEYDANGYLVGFTDLIGRKVQYTYNEDGKIISQVDDTDRILSYTYDDNGNILSSSITGASQGEMQTITKFIKYDALGNQVEVTDAEGNVSRAEYYSTGKISAFINAKGNRTEYRYDDLGNLIEVYYPDNTIEKFEYDAEGRNTKTISRGGKVTYYEYDKLGRISRTYNNQGTINQYKYDAIGNITELINANGSTTTYKYDKLGRNTSIIDCYSNQTNYEYDELSRITTMINAKGNKYSFSYDAYGNKIETVYPDGTSTKANYDEMGRLLEETDAEGHKTLYTYDNRNLLTSVTNANGSKWKYEYDDFNNLVKVIDANGHSTQYEYDKLGRRTKTILPLGMTSVNKYDEVGNRVESVDYNGSKTSYEYDHNGRIIKKTLANGDATLFSYTNDGSIKQVISEKGTTSYEYTSEGQLYTKTNPDGVKFIYSYDISGNLAQIKVDNQTINYTYDDLERLSSVEDNGQITKYTYDQNGNRESIVYPNGIVVQYIYDNLNRLTEEKVFNNQGQCIEGYTMKLGKAGQRLEITELNGTHTQYKYDEVYRLIYEKTIQSNGTISEISYTYDKVGNRLSKMQDGIVIKYTYNENDQLISEGNLTYQYDSNGNLISKNQNQQKIAEYQYNLENKLIKFIKQEENVKVVETYEYDWEGNRIQKNINGTEKIQYLVETSGLARVIAETNHKTGVVTYYCYGSELISLERSSGKQYYLFDGLLNVRMLSDSKGIITDTYLFDGFGNLLSQTGDTENSYLYRGEQYDANSGFYYLRARYMNPRNGVFASRDVYEGSLFEPASLHKYMYANANPITYSDPTGMNSIAESTATMETMSMADAAYRFASSVALRAGMQLMKIAYSEVGNISFNGLADVLVPGALDIPSLEEYAADINILLASLVDKANKIVANGEKVKPGNETKRFAVYALFDEIAETREVKYIGRTDDVARRLNEHKRKLERKDWEMIVLQDNLSERMSRLVEQSYISAYTLDKLANMRREIASGKVDKYGGMGDYINAEEWKELLVIYAGYFEDEAALLGFIK
ncbi:RHS repeat-associated core domain-containing protein [Cellulosilyticum sp. WCF-2]|uniref:RHS repeat-associated core domain-containing protein n=1 Tax=Cellulosilyticum sp. WCF-2 TaxID=2497860 RepID=UPI000F8E11C2|nr:RHS repeat-associated core domain-containing protein [Cellulosilyticum sp. WCF-2]QEH67729.1 hypothetical protein EKH84_04680 [Cellulosilyticum sp. WCF-2]